MDITYKYNIGDRITFQGVPLSEQTDYTANNLLMPYPIENASGLIIGRGSGDYAILFDNIMCGCEPSAYHFGFADVDSIKDGFDIHKEEYNRRLLWVSKQRYESYMYLCSEMKVLDLEEMI